MRERVLDDADECARSMRVAKWASAMPTLSGQDLWTISWADERNTCVQFIHIQTHEIFAIIIAIVANSACGWVGGSL